MAVVLERYLSVGPFSDVEARLVSEISQYLFIFHHRAAQTKRIIEFFHVSKSGGTSFCQLGRLNGCKTQSFGSQQNCLITYFRDSPRWTKAGALGELSKKDGDPWCARYGRQYGMRWHCRARRQLLTRMRFNFYANELVMHDHNHSWVGVHPCREFLNVVIFRSPTARVISHMQNILKEYLSYYNESLWTAFDPDSPAQWKKLAVPVFDNYVVRSLLGGKAYNMPFGAINSTHLLAAKVVTLQFEVLLTLAPETSELTRDIFGLGLGWQYDLRHMHVRPTKKHAVNKFSPQVLEAVRVASALDKQLYDFALVIQLLDAITFGVAHDVAGMESFVPSASGDGGEDGLDKRKNLLRDLSSAASREQTAAARGNGHRGCGYVGVLRKQSVHKDDDHMILPPVQPELAPFNLTDAELNFAMEKLGAMVIAGGRWFNGSFYRNATAALEVAAAVGRAKEAALVAMEAVNIAMAAQEEAGQSATEVLLEEAANAGAYSAVMMAKAKAAGAAAEALARVGLS